MRKYSKFILNIVKNQENSIKKDTYYIYKYLFILN